MLLANKFDERVFPLTDKPVPGDYHTMIPADDEIYAFMSQLFHAAAVS